MLRGIVRYCRFHRPWILFREPPFYRRPPYHVFPTDTRTPTQLRDQHIDGIITFIAKIGRAHV